jgi:hypothetical protein
LSKEAVRWIIKAKEGETILPGDLYSVALVFVSAAEAVRGIGGEGKLKGVGLAAGANVGLDGLAAETTAGLKAVEAVGKEIAVVANGMKDGDGRELVAVVDGVGVFGDSALVDGDADLEAVRGYD